MKSLLRAAAVLCVVLTAGSLPAQDKDAVGVVSNVTVLSDKVEDMSSLEAWKAGSIKPGMSDEEKGVVILKTVIKYRHQTAPPMEYLQSDLNVHDFMKTVHVYGYGMCCCAAANVEELGRYLGYGARGRIIHAHSVAELQWDGKWHLLDPSVMNYFHAPDGSVASVNEIIAAVKDWHAKNPGYRMDERKLREFAKNEGWKQGPPMLAGAEEWYTRDGANHAGWHGWYSTMQEYDCKPDQLYEYAYGHGYRPNVQLRPGERVTRNWFNKGLHVNMDGSGGVPEIIAQRAGMGLQRKYGDIAPGRVGNGTHEYNVRVGDASLKLNALTYEGLAARDGKLRVVDPNTPGVLVIRMPSSYVYLSGKADVKAVVGGAGRIAVSFSDNNGLDWKEVAKIDASGEQVIDLKSRCFRRYDYRLKFEMTGAGTGLDALSITHDIQHAQTPLPAFTPGENTVTFTAGPPEGTVTLEGLFTTDENTKAKQLVAGSFHPTLEGMDEELGRVKEYGPIGVATFPVATPGDMTRLRFGGHLRMRDAREGWSFLVSFDDGKTWKTVDSVKGPTRGLSHYVTFADVPQGTRKALVRFQSTRQFNTLCVFHCRIDADYTEPAGGFRPVRVTYVWEEDGEEKRNVHVARRPKDSWKVRCADGLLMKSLIVELAE